MNELYEYPPDDDGLPFFCEEHQCRAVLVETDEGSDYICSECHAKMAKDWGGNDRP